MGSSFLMDGHGAVILGQTSPSHSTFELDVKAQFAATWDRLDMTEERILSELPKPLPQPVQSRAVGSAVAVPVPGGAGFAVIDCGGPSRGHAWQVLSIAIGGLSTLTTASGRADIFISTMDFRLFATLEAPGLSDWRDFSTALPNVAFYDKDQMYLRGPEHLYVVISSATAGQEYVAAATLTDLQDGAALQVVNR